MEEYAIIIVWIAFFAGGFITIIIEELFGNKNKEGL